MKDSLGEKFDFLREKVHCDLRFEPGYLFVDTKPLALIKASQFKYFPQQDY